METATSASNRAVLYWVVALGVALAMVIYGAFNARAAEPDIAFRISPASHSLEGGSTSTYVVVLTSVGGFAGSVGLSASGLPGGSRSSLSPAALTLGARGGTSTATSVLTVTTTARTPAGSYTLKVTGTSRKVSGSITAGLSVDTPTEGAVRGRGESLIGSGQPGDFTISGRVSGLLFPGRSLPLSMKLSNPNRTPLSVTSLAVTMEKLVRTRYAIVHHQPCSLGDYAVIQYRGPYPLVVPGSSGLTLSQLGVAANQWPQVQLVSRPVNQDGCKGAALTLSYSGSGN